MSVVSPSRRVTTARAGPNVQLALPQPRPCSDGYTMYSLPNAVTSRPSPQASGRAEYVISTRPSFTAATRSAIDWPPRRGAADRAAATTPNVPESTRTRRLLLRDQLFDEL